MAMNPIYVGGKVKKGGGLFGKVIGGLAGLAAAPFTGGSSLLAAPALMGAGSMAGGAIGEAVSPTTITEPKSISTLDTALKADPQAQLAMLSDGQKSLSQYPMGTSEMETGYNYLEAAKQDLLRRMKIGTSNTFTGR
jgi:hypothetical protein